MRTSGRLTARFWSRVARRGPGECWEWTGGRFSGGYGELYVFGKNVKAHRYSYELLVGPIPAGMFVCHRCDNPPCVNPAHLFIGSPRDNVIDAFQKGRRSYLRPRYGAEASSTKLTKEIAAEVRATFRRYDRVFGYEALARRFGVSHTAIQRIVIGRTWRTI
jgi:hypothetical protein